MKANNNTEKQITFYLVDRKKINPVVLDTKPEIMAMHI